MFPRDLCNHVPFRQCAESPQRMMFKRQQNVIKLRMKTLLARDLARRSCGGTTSCDLRTSPCPMRGLCSQAPIRAYQSERDAILDLDGWFSLTVHDRKLHRQLFEHLLSLLRKSTTAQVLLDASSCNPCSLAVSLTCMAKATSGSSSAAVSLTGRINRPSTQEALCGSPQTRQGKHPAALRGARSPATDLSSQAAQPAFCEIARKQKRT